MAENIMKIELESTRHGAKRLITDMIRELVAKTNEYKFINGINGNWAQELLSIKHRSGKVILNYRFFPKPIGHFSLTDFKNQVPFEE